MSWDGYIDNLISQCKDASGTVHCDKACIIGLDGGAAWTTPSHDKAMKLSPTEAATIAKALKSRDYSSFQSGGVFCEGQKYNFLRNDEGVVYCKKKDHGAITLQASKTAILVGHCPEGCQQGNLNKGISTVVEYLESLGY